MTNIFTMANTSPGLVHDILSKSSHMTVWSDTDFRLVMGNESYIKTLGYRDLDHLVGSTYDLQPSEGGDLYEEWIKQDKLAIETNQKVHLLSYIKPYSGEDRLLIYGVRTPIYDKSDQRIIGVCGEFFDMTLRSDFSFLPKLNKIDSKYIGKNQHGAFTYIITDKPMAKIKLSKRESECLFFIMRGKTAKDIAKILKKSKRTVEHCIDNLKYKMKCDTRSALIDSAIEMGLLNLIPSRYVAGILHLI